MSDINDLERKNNNKIQNVITVTYTVINKKSK